jgi:hypothetical protein
LLQFPQQRLGCGQAEESSRGVVTTALPQQPNPAAGASAPEQQLAAAQRQGETKPNGNTTARAARVADTFLQPMFGLEKFIFFQLLFVGARAQLLGMLRTPRAAGLPKSSLQTKHFLQIGRISPATTVALTTPLFGETRV